MRPETLLEILSSLVTHCSCGLTLGLQPLGPSCQAIEMWVKSPEVGMRVMATSS